MSSVVFEVCKPAQLYSVGKSTYFGRGDLTGITDKRCSRTQGTRAAVLSCFVICAQLSNFSGGLGQQRWASSAEDGLHSTTFLFVSVSFHLMPSRLYVERRQSLDTHSR